MKRLLLILMSIMFLAFGCKIVGTQVKQPTVPVVEDDLELAEETEARVGILIEEADGTPGGFAYKIKVDNNTLTSITAGVATIDLSGAVGGQAVTFDVGDDGGDDSTDVGEIATTGDTNSVFGYAGGDKILIAVGNNWPTADLAEDVALGADGDFGDYDVKSIDGLYGVDDDIYIDMGTQGQMTLEADTIINITAPTDLGDEDITSIDKLEGVDNAVYIDLGADTLAEIVADGRVDITTPNLRLEVDALAYLNIATADGGATTISQTSDGTDQIIIGDGSDRVDIASDTWDVTNGVISTVTSIAFGADPADAGAVRLSNNTSIVWEKAATGTDIVGISVDGSDILQIAASGSSGVTITPATTITGVLTATNAGANITLAEGQRIHAGLTQTDAVDEGLVLPECENPAGITPTTDLPYICWDTSAQAINVYEGGWVAIEPSGAPTTATYITQTAEAGLSAEQALGVLASGILYSTTSTGIVSIATEAQMEATSGALFGASKAVTSGYIWVADGTDFESVAMSGDVTISAGGATVVGDDSHAHVVGDIDSANSSVWIDQVADETGTGKWVFATAPTFTTSIAFNAVTDTIAGVQNQNIVDKTAAEVISGAWEFQDDVATAFGNDADWTVLYDETTSDALEFTHAAGAGADVTFDLNDNAAASTFTITNSDATYVANLVVEGSITSTSAGDSYLSLTDNTSGYTASTYAMYVDDGTWKFFDTSEHDIVHEGANPNWDGTTHDFTGIANLILPTTGVSISGGIAIVTGNELQWHDGTKVITIDTTPTNDNYVLKYDNASATFTLEADETGGTPAWNSVTAPTADVDLIHDAGEETAFTYTGNFTTGSQFRIEQLTGTPTGGVLFEVKNATAGVTIFEIDDQGETFRIGYNASNTFEFSTGSSVDNIIGLASYSLGAAGVKITGDGDGAITFLGLGNGSDEDLTINLDDTSNEATITSSTGVALIEFGTINLATDALDLSDGNITNVADIKLATITADSSGITIDAVTTGEIVIGSADAKFSLISDALDISNTGAITGVSSITIGGDITLTGAAIDIDLKVTDDNALTIDDGGTPMLSFQTNANNILFGVTAEFDAIVSFDANPAIYDGSHYLTFDADGLSAAATIKFGGDTNNLLIANGTATIDLAASVDLNLDVDLTVDGQKTTISGVTQANVLTLNESFTIGGGTITTLTSLTQANTLTLNESFTIGDGNDGTITFGAASKTLTVSETATIDQDIQVSASPTFATITASTGFALGDTDYIGITGNEIITFNTAGTIVVSGAELTFGDPAGIVLSDDNYLELDATFNAMDDHEYNGIVIGGRNCGENLDALDVVFINTAEGDNGDIWHEADATQASGEYPAFGISVAACTDTNEARILVTGIIRDETWTGLTVAGPVYLGEADGTLTQTAPSTSNDAVQIIGWALSDSEIYFDFSRPYQLVE